jgi:thymidine kinase
MSITLITGPMFAGKSSMLIQEARRCADPDNGGAIMIKHSEDRRYQKSCGNDAVSSHDGDSYPAIACCTLSDVEISELVAKNVFVDEGQFFTNMSYFATQCTQQGKNVYVSGLDTDYLQRPFAETARLAEIASKVVRLTARCRDCEGDAAYTKRKGENDSLIVVGGEELYFPVCKRCL